MFNNLWLNIVAIFPENRSNILFSFFFLELILCASVKSIKEGEREWFFWIRIQYDRILR